MAAIRIIAIVLIAAGTLALIYGGFTFTKESHDADLGPIHFSVKDKQRVNIPVWAGAGAIATGTLLLVVRRKR